MVVIENVSKVYLQDDKPVQALKNLDLKVDEGSIYGIIGYSGAGKSTLVKLLNNLEKPTEGHIYIDGIELANLSKKELQQTLQKIGMVYQHFNLLWSRTVLENVMLPLEISNYPKDKRKAKGYELLELVGLKDQANAYPAQLSGGQKQRVGIARALINKPKLLLCDEATSALDPQTTSEILDLLQEINTKFNLTIIIISHEMDVVKKLCHKIAVIDGGSIVEENTTQALFASPKQDITKKFIGKASSDLELEIAQAIIDYPNDVLVKLAYQDQLSTMPILSSIIKQFDIEVSIIHAAINHLNKGNVGFLLLKVSKNDLSILQEGMLKHDVNIEVLS
ncbi:MAG: methionine ABC transporter ATP-binding protein [Bacilli bacterium]